MKKLKSRIRTSVHATLSISMLAVLSVMATGCVKANQKQDGLDVAAERDANFLAVDSDPQNPDPIRRKLGSFFLVEHFDVSVNPSMLQAIASHQPGGIVFWNPRDVEATAVREVVRTYSKASKAAGLPPILFSADYEGGGLGLSPSGANIPGIQRFHKGFSPLAHPIWLGEAETKFGPELCSLHGKIMAKELGSVGINYPLSVTSDLAMRLFTVRGISKSPEVSVPCLEAISDAFAQYGNSIFVTKHFPGLGQTLGDTHDTVAISQAKTPDEAELHLTPFRKLIAYNNNAKTARTYSIMASHGKFPFYDNTSITTESPAILQGLLRQKLGFKGLLVSDAMWMGAYDQLGREALMQVYFKAFLSGMNMLMIPGSKFADSISFFRDAYDNRLSEDTKRALEVKMNMGWEQIRALYRTRIQESLDRLDAIRATLKQPVDSMDQAGVQPLDLTKAERSRYYDILNDLDSRWVARLPRSSTPR